MKIPSLIENLQEHCIDDTYLSFLRERAKRCCCKYCGGMLEVHKLTYSNCNIARLELVCSLCGRIEFGTEQDIFQRAQYFVAETGFDYYPDLNQSLQKTQMNTAKICEITGWMLKSLNLLQETGFTCEQIVKEGTYGDGYIIEDCEKLE